MSDQPAKPPQPKKLFHTLTLGGGPMVKGLDVFLDGMPLKGVTSLEIRASPGDVVRAVLELIVVLAPSQLEVDAEFVMPMDLPEHLKLIADDLLKLKEATDA